MASMNFPVRSLKLKIVFDNVILAMAAERVKKYDCTSVIICYLLGKKISRKVETVVRGQG
jgi:hypothetical protein